MSEKKLKRQILRKKLFNKRRLVILNEDTFEETFSLKLNLMNVFVVATVGAILIIFVTTYIIAFTPLREYIPGYSSSKLKQDALSLAIKSDSLDFKLKTNQEYLNSIKKVLVGELDYAKLSKDSIQPSDLDKSDLKISASEEEKKLREDVQREDKYNVFSSSQPKVNFVLFPPVNAKIVKAYNPSTKNYSVELAVAKDTPVKSVSSGSIIFADWTPTFGYVVIIKHKDDLISVYKNIDYLTKSARDNVKSGEVIGQSGNSNTNSGTNLKFELWKEGFPINPSQYINFQ